MGFPIVKADPSFGNTLGNAIGQGFGGGFQEGLSSQLNKMLDQKKNYEAASGYADFLGLEGKPRTNFLTAFGNTSADKIPGALKEIAQYQEIKSKTQDIQKQKEKLQETFDRLSEITASGRVGKKVTPKSIPWINPKSAEERAEFNTAVGTLEGIYKDLVNKGQMSQARFEYMLSLLPKDTDRERTIIGKMKAISREIGVDESKLLDFIEQKRAPYKGNPSHRNPRSQKPSLESIFSPQPQAPNEPAV